MHPQPKANSKTYKENKPYNKDTYSTPHTIVNKTTHTHTYARSRARTHARTHKNNHQSILKGTKGIDGGEGGWSDREESF